MTETAGDGQGSMTRGAASLGRVEVPVAADVVSERLRRAIHIGTFLPGDRLPPERELAAQLGVSRVTLREALRALEHEGLIKLARRGPGGGAEIREPQAGSFHAELRGRRAELEAVFEFRAICEAAAAGLAAERRRAADVKRLDAALNALTVDISPGDFRAADNEFHLAIAEAAGNRRLLQAVEDSRAEMFKPLDTIPFEVILPSTLKQHGQIRRAIDLRQVAAASRIMREHVESAKREVLAALAAEDSPVA